MLTFINVKFIFESARLRLFSPANILQIVHSALGVVLTVLAMFLANISPSSYSRNE